MSFPDYVEIENLLVYDTHGDTLLYTNHARVDLDMWALKDGFLKTNQLTFKGLKINILKKSGELNLITLLNKINTKKDTSKSSFELQYNFPSVLIVGADIRFFDGTSALKSHFSKMETGFSVFDIKSLSFQPKNTTVKDLSFRGFIGKYAKDTLIKNSQNKFKILPTELRILNSSLALNLVDVKKNINAKNLNASSLFYFQQDSISVQNTILVAKELGLKSHKSDPKNKYGKLNLDNIKLVEPKAELADFSIIKSKIKAGNLSLKFTESINLNADIKVKNLSLIDENLTIKESELRVLNTTLKQNINYNLGNNALKISDLQSTITSQDLLYFKPELIKNKYFKAYQDSKFIASGDIVASKKGIDFSKMELKGTRNLMVSFNGKYENEKLSLNVKDFYAQSADIKHFYESDKIALPDFLKVNGLVQSQGQTIDLKLNTLTNFGPAQVNLALNTATETYKGDAKLNKFLLGKLIKNTDLGLVSGTVNFNGSSFTKPNINYETRIESVVFKDKFYTNLQSTGNLRDNILDLSFDSNEPGKELTWSGKIDLNNPEIAIKGNTYLKNLDLQALGLSEEKIFVSGDFDIHDLQMQENDPLINLSGKNLKFKINDKSYPLASIKIQTQKVQNSKELRAITPFADLKLQGVFTYTSVLDVFKKEIHKHFKIPNFDPIYSSEKADVKLSGRVTYDSLFTGFIPKLKSFEPIDILTFVKNDSETPLAGIISIPSLWYDSLHIKHSTLDFVGSEEEIKYTLLSEELKQGDFRVRNASLEGEIKDNKANFSLAIKDSLDQRLHAVKGNLESIQNGVKINFDESGTFLSYQPWSGNPYGYLTFTNDGLSVNNIVFSTNDQILRLNSLSDTPNGPLMLFAENLDLGFFSKSFLRDSALLGGKFRMDLELVNYLASNPAFTGDFSVKDLYYEGKALGDLTGFAETGANNQINLRSDLKNEVQDVNIAGYISPDLNQNYDFDVTVKKFDAKTLSIWTETILKDIDGSLAGNFNIKGDKLKNQIKGDLKISDLSFRLVETGAFLSIKNQTVPIKNQELTFTNFLINDIENKPLDINGKVNLKKLPEYSYDLDLNTKNFKIIEAKEGENLLYKGVAYIDSKINIKGKNLDFKCTGDLNLIDKTDLTLLNEEEEGSTASVMQKVINFKESPNIKSVKIKEEKKSKIDFANAVNLNVNVEKEAIIRMLMDPVTGDLLSANGTGRFNIGFNNNADLYMIGNYQITKGVYNLTYQVIQKEFVIDPYSGSNIVWTGDPMQGKLNVTASYLVPGKKTLMPGVQTPIRVDLNLTGPIMQPDVNFDLVVRDANLNSKKDELEKLGFKLLDKNGKKSAIELSNSQKTEVSNMAILVLLTGTINSDQFVSNMTKGQDFENVARQKASELISSQLENYASNIIKGIDINLGLDSKTDTTFGKNTNLSFGISKRLANERLILSVGKNFELENSAYRSDEIFDNLQADWVITKDGKYRLNVFRKNLTNLVIEGQVVETGLGFVVAIDYDSWKKLVKNKP